MLKISIKNRLLAIGTTVAASLLATAGLFFAINNLTGSLASFENITTENTVLKIELFSPLLASIKNNKPATDFETINSTLQQSVNLLANNLYNQDAIKDLLGSQGHSLLNYTANGDIYLVTNKNNKFSKATLLQPLYTNSKVIDELIVYSNSQDLINNINKNKNVKDTILISFNDIAKITVLNKLFTTNGLTNALNNLKTLLQPLSAENISLTATIQQSNHRTKIQFTNLNAIKNNQPSSLSPLLEYLPRNASFGYLSNNSSTTINSLANEVNGELLAKQLVEDQPLLFAKNAKNEWLVVTNSKDIKQIENLASLFANLYDTRTTETVLPDGSYAKEIKIKDAKTLIWQKGSTQTINWQLKNNPVNDLTIANNNDVYIFGKSALVNETISKGGYYPEDCEINEVSTVIVQGVNNKTMYYSENTSNNAIYCIFN